MLSQAVGDLLPVAAAVALSPIPIIAVVLVLGTPRARTSGPAFALGWMAGLTAVSTIVVLVAGGSSHPDSDLAEGVNWFKVFVGGLCLVLALRQWMKRPAPGTAPEMPGWMATVGSASPAKAFGLGVTLSGANPKNLALTLAFAATLAEAGPGGPDTAIAIAVFVAIGSVTVVGAVAVHLIAPARSERPLAAIQRFMARNNATIMSVVLVLLGMLFLSDGLTSV